MDYLNKVVWVTGASSGIGKALCEKLDALGARLILSSRKEQDLRSVLNTLGNPAKHHILPFDLSHGDQARSWVETAWQFNGGIDILINNGGISQRGLAVDTLLPVDRRIMEVDYFGTIALTKALLPYFIERRSGTIVNIASIAGKVGVGMRTAYCGAKHALVGFMDCLRAEVASSGIKVYTVCPGFVRTNLSRNALKGNMKPYAKMDNEINNGMSTDKFVRLMLSKIGGWRGEIIIAEGLAKFGYQARRFVPNIYHWMLPKIYTRKD
ncbi:SDR family NAD(P)-dependent oxidoreductase [Aliikangiella sp. G2MR2-5]|uniref:SDR family NAD(P)-dependent oxidoreductase n=1 Tax=Aliikangiella sp. G2MR2-5 TaxID=2788943 RepID=UPI0018A92F2E|nr:SDR family NAD(P)-dependent oxidoreductase [Aliikangiella sp. G2MR2-5]